jgi:predicted secreted protein
MSLATSGLGTQFQRGDGGGTEVFSTIAEVQSIAGPTMKTDIIDVSNMDSPNSFKERIGGLKDPGTVTFDINFIPQNAGQKLLFADFQARTVRNFKIKWPDAANTTASFAGLIDGWEYSSQIDKQMMVKVAIAISGAVTVAP